MVISPVRDEATVIERTARSMLAQTEPPALWLIVDDGSTDGTADIVRRVTRDAGFVRVMSMDNEPHSAGDDRLKWAAEALAFNAGLRSIADEFYDFIAKLDGDLEFGPDYFSSLLDEFDRDPALGIAGGHCYSVYAGKRSFEWVPESHVRGATKMYRRACFEEIGGIPPVYGWDTIDELRAQMRGWRTRSVPLAVDHLRPTGSRGGQLRGLARMGRGAYLLGYHPLFLLARAGKTAFVPPYVAGALAFLYGYCAALIERPALSADAETVSYLRAQQIGRLRGLGDLVEVRSLFGKEGR